MSKFIEVFSQVLRSSMESSPERYTKSYEDTLKAFTDIAFKNGSYDKNGESIKKTCKILNIKNTYLDIDCAIQGKKRDGTSI